MLLSDESYGRLSNDSIEFGIFNTPLVLKMDYLNTKIERTDLNYYGGFYDNGLVLMIKVIIQ